MNKPTENQGREKRERRERRENAKPIEEYVALSIEWLEGLGKTFDLNIKVDAEGGADGGLSINIGGPDAAQFLEGFGMGRGQLATHIQTLLQAVLYREGWETGDLFIDVQNFRKKRGERLTRVAGMVGDKVVELGKPITILGMNSFDRRLVHTTLEPDKRVKTESEGYGMLRRLKVQ